MSKAVNSVGAIDRRRFLGMTAAGAVTPFFIGGNLTAQSSGPNPNGLLQTAIIGCGGISRGHTNFFSSNEKTWVTAVCDVDLSHAENRKSTVDQNCAKRLGKENYDGCLIYRDFREVLARRDIDIVIVCTPDHWHVPISTAAMRSGRDVYCEKPLTLTVREGRSLVDAARRYGRVLQTGSQQRSGRRFRQACELVRNGRIGRLRHVETRLGSAPRCDVQQTKPIPENFDYDMWLGPAPWAPYTPKRCHGTFRWIRDYSGGKMTDWGAHHNDIAQWGIGMEKSGPVEISGRGDFPDEGLYNVASSFLIEYRYANGVRLTCRNDKENGIRFEGTDGWIFVSRRQIDAEPKSVLESKIGPDEIHLYQSNSHHGNFLDCVESRADTVACPEIAHRSATVCHLGNIAMLLGRKVEWDPDREEFPGDEEANALLTRPMRGNWMAC